MTALPSSALRTASQRNTPSGVVVQLRREYQQPTREQQARQAAQCAGSRRILAAHKACTDLMLGGRADLWRFEDKVGARRML
ncbi:MAG: hypothetical protein ACK40S_11680 [Burkholderiaceae bacterium]